MNIQDPFNLRRGKSALSIIHQSAVGAASSAVAYAQQAVESGRPGSPAEKGTQEVESSSPGSEGMSFTLPKNVPSFDHPQRRYEDHVWQATRASGNGQRQGKENLAHKLGELLWDDADELPLYKDKPYNHARYGRRSAWLRRKRSWILAVFALAALYYWLRGHTPASGAGRVGDRKGSWWISSTGSSEIDWDARRDEVKEAFKLSWDAYERHAWGYDEFHPVSKRGRQMVENGMGWIIVDALDTLMLMNLTTELSHARNWISTSLDYEKDHDVNTFETTIRMLGGLLSAHYLSTSYPSMAPLSLEEGAAEEDLYLEKASDLADRLLGAYDSSSGVPYASINLKTRQGIRSHADGGASSTAEATSLQLEMKYLAYLTGEENYWEKAEKVMQVVDDNRMEDGLLPIFISADTGTFRGSEIRLGSRGDSYYEYLIKQYLQTSKREPVYLEMWEEALAGVRKHLITYSYPSNFTVLAERPSGLNGPLLPKMDHLVCFMPGTIALSATNGETLDQARQSPSWGSAQERDLELAKELMKTCWGMYKVTATGLAPEIAHFNIYNPPMMLEDGVLQSPDHFDDAADARWRQDYVLKPADVHNLQRPETVESLFYMWRITGDETYRHWGWEMFEAFQRYTRVADDGGYTSIGNVNQVPNPPSRDNMESFWLAETLKYFYLLFGPDDVLPLDRIVLNTEAHPFPRFDPSTKRFATGWARVPRPH